MFEVEVYHGSIIVGRGTNFYGRCGFLELHLFNLTGDELPNGQYMLSQVGEARLAVFAKSVQ